MAMTEADGGYMPTSSEPPIHAAGVPAGGCLPTSGLTPPLTPWRGFLVCVTGTGGVGSSLLAMCLAAELADDASNRGLVVLADFTATGGQARMHGCRSTVMGVEDLAEACSGGRLGRGVLRSMITEPAGRSYHLVLGRRGQRDTAAARDGRMESLLDSLLSSYRFVVADVDTDLEELGGIGSVDAADRSRMTLRMLSRSDLIVVVGTADTESLSSLVRAIDSLAGSVDADRILPVINRLPRSSKRRSAAAAAIVRVLESTAAFRAGDPVLLPEQGSRQRTLRDGAAPPAALGRPLASEVRTRLLATGLRSEDLPG